MQWKQIIQTIISGCSFLKISHIYHLFMNSNIYDLNKKQASFSVYDIFYIKNSKNVAQTHKKDLYQVGRA